ncbi:LOW QUALITY PROTEIN: solute carrier family 35 member G1-like [Pollicipes pollicipes]|uniref:LOW QUALITY PROTEIN: solute carrier family 35 member G1-like n=1 Tax=Pollicipes pollicipes TaxID=41117 RepID=UPI001884B596|nr:LOW QUALITY PROTEIN: solute carrier family 35 member G1-like [Pollicipes pollicipes]
MGLVSDETALLVDAEPQSASDGEAGWRTNTTLPATPDRASLSSDAAKPAASETTQLLPKEGAAAPRRRCAAQLGLLYALLAAFCSSLVNALVKGVTTVDPAALSAFRFLIILVPTGAVALSRRQSVFPRGKRGTLMLRSVLGTVGLVTKFYAMRLMPLADASVIVLSVPVFVAVFARIFLKEPFTWVNAVTIVGTVAGIVLIVRPPMLFGGASASYNVIGPILAITSNVFTSNTYVTLRQLKDVHYSATVTVFCLTAIPLSVAVWLLFGDRSLPTCSLPWLLVLAIGLLSFLVQMFFTKATQLENAGPVSVVRTTDILFAVMWQVVWFDSVPGLFSWLGMGLVVSSVLLVAGHKWYMSRHSARQEEPKASQEAPTVSR